MFFETNSYTINILPKAVLDVKSASGAKKIYILMITEKSNGKMYSWQFDTINECHEQRKEFFECVNADYAREQARLYASNL